MVDVILDTLLDFVKIVPVLFLTYLLMEFIEHRMGDRTKAALSRAGVFAPAVGGLLGVVPQCGFSAAAAGLYAGRVVSVGTLFAVFLSTSDEMLPVMLSHAWDGTFALVSVLRVLLGKLVIGIVVGMVIDLVLRFILRKKRDTGDAIGSLCHHDGCHCERGILRSALHHTVEISLFILLVTFSLNTLIHYIGEDVIADFITRSGVFGYFLSSLVGLIPNCAASVVITELYLSRAISVGCLFSGLLTGAGIGVLVLFRVNRSFRENLLITAGLYLTGVLFGWLIDLADFSFLGLAFL